MRQSPCPVKDCQSNIQSTNPYGVCGKHADQINCMLYALPKIRTVPAPTSKILVPGTPQYNTAVFDIAKRAK